MCVFWPYNNIFGRNERVGLTPGFLEEKTKNRVKHRCVGEPINKVVVTQIILGELAKNNESFKAFLFSKKMLNG